MFDLSIPATWNFILSDKSDLEKLMEFGGSDEDGKPKMLKYYNVWNFKDCDPRLGQEFKGRIPGQIVMNLLYYYTEQGDLVVDPMAGGGSTIDACLVMNRKCRAYDINPVRKDILKCDIQKGFPEEAKNAELIFLDP